MLDHNCQLPMPIFLEWNRRTVFGKYIFSSNGNWNNFCPSYDSHSVFLNMRETSWHLLRLGTWNLMDILPKPMLSNAFLWRIVCSRIGQKPCCTKCEWYAKALFQTAHFCNKFQVKFFFFNDSAQFPCHPVPQRKVSAPKGVIFICHHSYDLSQICESFTNTATKL